MSEEKLVRYHLGIKRWWGWQHVEVVDHRLQTELDGKPIAPRLIYRTGTGNIYSVKNILDHTWCVLSPPWDEKAAYQTRVEMAAEALVKPYQEHAEQEIKKRDEEISRLKAEADIFRLKADDALKKLEAISQELRAKEELERSALLKMEQDFLQQSRAVAAATNGGAQGWPSMADQRSY